MSAGPRAASPADAGAALLAILDARVRALFEELLRERGENAGDPLIRSDKLGPQNRIILGLIRRGELAAVTLGNRLHVRRSEWMRYVAKLEAEQAAKLRAATPANDGGPVKDDLEAAADRVLAEMGLERKVPPHEASGRRR